MDELLLDEERVAVERLREARDRRKQYEHEKRSTRKQPPSADAIASRAAFYALWLRHEGNSPEEARRKVLERYPSVANLLR